MTRALHHFGSRSRSAATYHSNTITHPLSLSHFPGRNLWKVLSVQILSPKPAICNLMRCLAVVIRPRLSVYLNPLQRFEVTGEMHRDENRILKYTLIEMLVSGGRQ